jgi:hypothetical protein
VTLRVLFKAMMNFTCRSVVQPSLRMRREGAGLEEPGGAESWVRIGQRGADEILLGKGIGGLSGAALHDSGI